MAQDLRILITGSLNSASSLTEINRGIEQLQGKINKLNLSVKIDQNVLKTLNDFSSQMSKIADIAKNTGKVIQESINPDGSRIKTTYYNGLKGEFSQVETAAKQTANTVTKSTEEQQQAINKLTQSYQNLTRETKSYNEQAQLTRNSQTYQNGNNTLSVNNTSTGTSYRETLNPAKDAKDAQNYINWWSQTLENQDKQEQQLIEQMEQFRLQSLQRVQQRELQWNTAQQQSIQRNGDLERQEIARTEASRQQYENWWGQALNNRELQNKNLQQSLTSQAQQLLGSGSTKLDYSGLNKLVEDLKNLDHTSATANRDLAQMQSQLRGYTNQVHQAHESTLTFGEAIRQSLSGLALWSATATILYAPIRALEDMSQRLIQIDSQMTEINRILGGMDQFKLNDLLQNAIDESDQLKNKLTDTLSIMSEFATMGYKSEDLGNLSKVAEIMTNISGLDAKSAVDSLVSAMVNFNIQTKDAMSIEDKFSKVDQNFAVTTLDLAQGIQKAGASAKTFGVDIDSLNGYITAIAQSTRESGSVIGNSLKTIFSRMTTAKPSVDALESVGVSIKDLQGNVRPLTEIINDLAGKWDSLSNSQKQNLAVQEAGRFQVTRFLALMNNFNIAVQATKTSTDSQGSAMKSQAIYADSLQARINNLDNAWNKMVLSFGKAIVTDGLIAGVETLNSLANAVATVTKYVGVLPGVFGTVGVATVALNAKFRAFSTAIMFGTGALNEQQLALTGLTTEMTLADIATRTFTVSLRGIMVASGVGLALAGLGFILEKLVGNFADAQKAQENFKAEQQKGVDALTTSKQQTEDLINQYEKLSKIKSDPNKAWNTDDEQKYIQVQNQLAQIYPQLVSFMDGAGNAHLKNKQQIDKEIESTNKLIEAKNNLTKVNATDDIQKAMSNMDSLQNQMKAKKNNIQLGFNSMSDFILPSVNNPFGMSDKQKAKNESDIADLQKKWSDASQQINSKVLTISNAYNKLSINPAIKQSVDNFVSSLDLSKVKDPTTLDTYAKKVANLTDKMQQAYKSGDKTAFNDARDSLTKYTKGMVDTDSTASRLSVSFNDVKKATDAMKNATFSGKDGLDGLDTSMSDTTDTASTLSDQLKKAKGDFSAVKDVIMEMIKAKQYDQAITASENEAYSSLSDSISPVNKMLEDMANGQSITASTAMDVIQKVPEMTKYLSIENGQVKVNTQGVIDWRDAQIASFQDMINAEKAQIDAQSKGLKTKLANYGVEIKAILSVAEANQALADAEQKHAENAAKINGSNAPGAMHASMVEDSQYQSVVDGVNKIKDAYSSLDSLSSMASTGLTQVGTSMDKTNSSTEKSIYVTDKYKQSMDALNASLQKLQSEANNYAKGTKEYEDALQRQINLLQQQKDLTDAQAKNLQGQIASGIIQQTGMITTKSGGSSSSSSNYNYASGGSTQAQIWNFLKSKGLSDGAIAGIMGNLQQESGFNTSARNPNGATGLAQWMGGRLSNLQSQSNWTSLDTQLNFLWSEWQPMMSKYGASSFNSLNPTQAAYIFEKLFERSGGDANAKRQSYANQIYSQFAGSGGTYTGGITSSDTSKSAADAAQAIDQAKSDLLQLQQTSQGFADQMQQLKVQIIQDRAVMYDNLKKTYDDQLAQFDYLQNVQNKNSADWLHTQMRREEAYNTEIDLQKQSIDYLQQQIAYNTDLTAAQKQTLSDDVLQRQQELVSLEQKLYDTRSQMADEIVNTYKTALQDMKDASTKSIDNMINDINKQADQADYKKKLADAQKSAQDIQNEINKLMLDDSNAAKKRIADLQKQLSDQNNSITQMITDNNKQQQIDNLNAQKDAISNYYDNMLNDEQKFSQMRSDILNINNQSIINSLTSLSTQVKQNVNILGTSVVNTLIDAINRANGYMYLGSQNSSVIGHIASLSTGGITPKFSGGKLAVLHQDEMISNKVDTSNFLKSINLVKDMVTNIFKPSNLNGILSPATAGGNTYQVIFNVDKMTGNQSDVNNFVTKFVNGIKSKGGVI